MNYTTKEIVEDLLGYEDIVGVKDYYELIKDEVLRYDLEHGSEDRMLILKDKSDNNIYSITYTYSEHSDCNGLTEVSDKMEKYEIKITDKDRLDWLEENYDMNKFEEFSLLNLNFKTTITLRQFIDKQIKL